MLKKIAKGILLSLMCTFIFTGNAYAGKAFYVFSLGNTGTTINHFSSSTNNKTIQSNPWTLKINSITCIGNYGIRFAPAKYNTTTKVLVRRVAHGEMELDMELLHMHQVMLVLQHIS